MSDDELATSIKAIRTLRRETNLALERLPTRNAQRVHDPLHAERKATNRLLTMLVSYVEETGATLRRIEERPIAWPPLSLDFSKRERCIGAENLRKVLCENSFFQIQDGPDADRV